MASYFSASTLAFAAISADGGYVLDWVSDMIGASLMACPFGAFIDQVLA
jgi:hypothetical protein